MGLILGVDPGWKNIGFALLLSPEGEVKRTRTVRGNESTMQDREKWQRYVFDELERWVGMADVVVYEQQWRAQIGQAMSGRASGKSHLVNEFVGALKMICKTTGKQLVEVTTAEAKAIVGCGHKAKKPEVQAALRQFYPAKIDSHSTDAVCIALAGEEKLCGSD